MVHDVDDPQLMVGDGRLIVDACLLLGDDWWLYVCGRLLLVDDG